MLPVLIGMVGLACEVSYWHLHQRAMQNAADGAAIAAATNSGSNYIAEAKAVAAHHGFPEVGSVAVAVTKSDSAPGCTKDCYAVTISDAMPLWFSQVVGYEGNVTVNKKGMTSLAAGSVATRKDAYTYCILALASSGVEGVRTSGAPAADLRKCTMMSNTSMTCHGHNLNASIADAHGTNKGCGITQHSNQPLVRDPYVDRSYDLPNDNCASYPQILKNGSPLPVDNQWKGTHAWSGYKFACGDQMLVGNTTVSAAGSVAVLVIVNGRLDLNGYTLNGSGLTVVFTGSNASSYQHIPTGDGTLNLTAPTSGNWSGVALYQHPDLTNNVDISYSGNNPTWNITGLVYLPHASLEFKGAVNKSSEGAYCFGLVIDNLRVSGSASIFANNTECEAAGLVLPGGGNRGTLVN